MDATDYKFGYVALLGEANAGKSTLLNAILGEKLSIVSDKPHTTRNQILGVLTTAAAQIAFLDAPGFIRKAEKSALKTLMKNAIRETRESANVIIYLIDSVKVIRDKQLLEASKSEINNLAVDCPVVIALNKIDKIDKQRLLPLIASFQDLLLSSETRKSITIVPVSALERDGVSPLVSELLRLLPKGSKQYADEFLTDRSEKFLASEVIREKLFAVIHQEIPYRVAVHLESWEETAELIKISACIIVEKESHKGIIIGAGGKTLKQIGTQARLELEDQLERKVYISLFVKVITDWTQSEAGLVRAEQHHQN
ncbi:GTPase Era [bacterium]|nr:GTPase Era [bacterium]